jgi:hypothetical protein
VSDDLRAAAPLCDNRCLQSILTRFGCDQAPQMRSDVALSAIADSFTAP